MPNTKTVSVENDFSIAKTTLSDKMPAEPLAGPQGMKAIGPRVTFNFISEPWSDDNSYEGYDVVQVAGVSYVAIKPVPTGIQIDDADYWFKWSEPNAQWSDLLDTVNAFDTRISDNASSIDNVETEFKNRNRGLFNSNILMIGDSIAAGYLVSDSYIELYCQDIGANLTNISNPGSGFTTTSQPTYLKLYNEWFNKNKQAEIDYVIIQQSVNDGLGVYTNSSAFLTAVKTLIARIKSTLVNSAIIGLSIPPSPYPNALNQVSARDNQKANYFMGQLYIMGNEFNSIEGVSFLKWPLNILSYKNNSNMNNDLIHPNQNGHNRLAKAIAGMFNGYVNGSHIVSDFTIGTDVIGYNQKQTASAGAYTGSQVPTTGSGNANLYADGSATIYLDLNFTEEASSVLIYFPYMYYLIETQAVSLLNTNPNYTYLTNSNSEYAFICKNNSGFSSFSDVSDIDLSDTAMCLAVNFSEPVSNAEFSIFIKGTL